VVGAQGLELAVDGGDLAVEVVDHRHRRQDPRAPRLREIEPREQLAPLAAEQVGHRAAVPEGQKLGVNAMLQRAALGDQEQPPARALTLGAQLKRRQPDRRDQIEARQLGQHPRVDAVGLARQRPQALDLLGIGDLDLPAAALQRVVHEPRAVHRLDRRPDGDRAMTQLDRAREPTQPIAVGRRRTDLDTTSLLIKQARVQP
jgi:hypothetical protein